jgi:hypothetical protein
MELPPELPLELLTGFADGGGLHPRRAVDADASAGSRNAM